MIIMADIDLLLKLAGIKMYSWIVCLPKIKTKTHFLFIFFHTVQRSIDIYFQNNTNHATILVLYTTPNDIIDAITSHNLQPMCMAQKNFHNHKLLLIMTGLVVM